MPVKNEKAAQTLPEDEGGLALHYPRSRVWEKKPIRYIWLTRNGGKARQVWRFELSAWLKQFIQYQTRILRQSFMFLDHTHPYVLEAIEQNNWIDGDWSIWSHSNHPRPWPFVLSVELARRRTTLVF